MARKKKTSRPSWQERWQDWCSRAAARMPRMRTRSLLLTALALTAAAGTVYGMFRLDAHVRRTQRDAGPPRIVFAERPPGMERITEDALAHFADVSWSHPTLCQDIADALRATGWVREVTRVHRYPDQRVDVACTFRKPVAMVLANRGCCLIDVDGVRLPGWYRNDPTFKLIVGISEPPPVAGESWKGQDARAAVELVQFLAAEHFNDQITGVIVERASGRTDDRGMQLVLATDLAGGRIVWGSPIGEEIEENTAEQKLELLRSNFRRFGRVDADRAQLDVSVHPDRILAPASAGHGGAYAER